jgi:SAM-dependent methyltransferase
MITSRTESTTDFASRMLMVLNDAAMALMASVGARVGLFDALDQQPPMTSDEIAQRAGLNERYVREWLAAMVTGRVVDFDEGDATYRLPEHRGAVLASRAGIRNLVIQTHYVALLAQVEDSIIDCFHHGGGLPYSKYPRFQEIRAERSAAVHDSTLTTVTLPLVPSLVERLELGIDVADVGCGSGHAINLMATTFPQSRFVGIDISEEGIAAANAEAASRHLDNARFIVRDAANLDMEESFDLVVSFDAVHDQARPDRMLAGIASSLRDDGTYLCVDIAAHTNVADNLDHPLGPFLYMISCLHCMSVSLADGGMGLGTMWGEEMALTMLGEAGFRSIDVLHVDGDAVNNYYVARKAPPTSVTTFES